MDKSTKVYDKRGTLVKLGDTMTDGTVFEEHWNELYLVGDKDMWKIEQFRLDSYKDGVLLRDFEICWRKQK